MSKPLSTDQKMFNKVARHLLRQNAKSMKNYAGDGVLNCAYRGNNGRRCAVGVLITNDEYRPAMEGESVEGYDIEPILLKRGYNITLCHDLQNVHDSKAVSDWPNSLSHLANLYSLKMPTK